MKKLVLFSLLASCILSVRAQDNWELKRNENGIEVYIKKSPVGNLKELRVVCELDATKEQLISTLQDIPNYNDWVFSNKKSTILKIINPDKVIYYTESRLPWPIKDRDLIVELNIDDSADVLNVQAKGLPGYLPKKNGYVRVPYSLATWKVTQIPNNKLKVDYTFSVDPGGSIPVWLVNATLSIGPYNSFVKLKELLRLKYKK